MESPHQKKGFLVLLSLLVLLSAPLPLFGNVHSLTREEASHTGFLYHSPPIIHEFNAFLLEHSSSPSSPPLSSLKQLNDFSQHHTILKLFCSQRLPSESCQWFEYYQLLDELRLPFLQLFDPGMGIGFKISDLQERYQSGSALYQTKCEIIRNPSPDEFLEYVMGSKPVIIRGSLPSSFKSASWSLSNLVEVLGETEVVVSATPTGEFDGPEDPTLWGLPSDPEKYELIVRPGHVNLNFADFVSLLTNSESRNSSQFYLEYFPLYAMFHPQEASAGAKAKEKKKVDLLQQLPQHPFAEWLSMKYHLLWLGGGEQESRERVMNRLKEKKSSKKSRKDRAREKIKKGGIVPVSRMHYDRMENLMTMITGRKKFYLYDPSQSNELHGGTPMIQASFKAQLVRNSYNNGLSVKYSRDPSTAIIEPNIYHTYSPVNVRYPNHTKHPKLRRAKGIICEITKGDTLYVPSHWWHEVVSYPDKEGKSIGINSFFEPFYHRYQYNTTSEIFQKNRYYEPIEKRGSTDLCGSGAGEQISCFVKPSWPEPAAMEKRRRTDKGRRMKPSRRTREKLRQQKNRKRKVRGENVEQQQQFSHHFDL